MAFQRSYSKVWWGSDNQLPYNTTTNHNLGNSLTSGGFYYSLYSSSSQSLQQQHNSIPNSIGSEHNEAQLPQFHHNLNHHHGGGQQQSSYQFNNGNNEYHSLDYNTHKGFIGNLSRIQEVDDEHNISKLSWKKHDSPGSLRSQDSGFSDNDESHSTRSLGGRSSTTAVTASPSSKSDLSTNSAANSPSSGSQQTIETPPTVIRRIGRSQFYSPAINVSRRISFSGTPTNIKMKSNQNNDEEHDEAEGKDEQLMNQDDTMQFLVNSEENLADSKTKESVKKIRRRKRVSRKPTTPLSPTRRRLSKDTQSQSDDDADESLYDSNNDDEDVSLGTNFGAGNSAKRLVPEYNNETVYLGEAPPPYNNETVILGGPEFTKMEESPNNTLVNENSSLTPMKSAGLFSASTSTPKATVSVNKSKPKYSSTTNWMPTEEYENPLLNGHSPSLQSWLYDIRSSYDHEVMSTLQTKSISREAYKNLTITTHTVSILIRQLQQKALYMQSDFERVERILSGFQLTNLHDALISSEQLIRNVEQFIEVLDRRAVFFSETRLVRKKYDEHIEQLRLLTKDIIYSISHQQYINLVSLLDDVQVLKRNLLVTVRSVFEKMVHVIVQSIEQSPCDLMLRANLNMVATLTNIDYEGFPSLSEAFVQNEAIRALLVVCLDHKLSSVRALALRALSTVCSSQDAIKQFGSYEGIEIIRDILHVQSCRSQEEPKKRTDTERREAVSVLTQITAAWHGPSHKVDGLKDCTESIVEGLSDLIQRTACCQTFLLCIAALNNLSWIEITSHYSIMSNETIFRIMEAMEMRQADDCYVFHYEQIIAMLNNMSLNKKCHSHLANASIINFITFVYQQLFYRTFDSRAENDAKRHIIKSILHILTRLVNDSSLGIELIDKRHIPDFFKMAIQNGNISSDFPIPGDYTNNSNHSIPSILNHNYFTAANEQTKTNQNNPEQMLAVSNENNVTIVTVDPGCKNSIEPLSLTNIGSMVTPGLKMDLKRNESFV